MTEETGFASLDKKAGDTGGGEAWKYNVDTEVVDNVEEGKGSFQLSEDRRSIVETMNGWGKGKYIKGYDGKSLFWSYWSFQGKEAALYIWFECIVGIQTG